MNSDGPGSDGLGPVHCKGQLDLQLARAGLRDRATLFKPVLTAKPEAAMTTHLAMLRGPVDELPQAEIDRCNAWFRQTYGQSGQKEGGRITLEGDDETGQSGPNTGAMMCEHEARDDLQAHEGQPSNVAIHHCKEGPTQSEISKRIGVSRASVVNDLRQARETDIVDIRIQGSAFGSSSLSRKLRQKHGLEDGHIARVTGEMTPMETMQLTAQFGAMAMFDLLTLGDWLGVSWGEPASAFSHRPEAALTVCQMLGSVSSPTLSAAEDCAIQLANRTNARSFILHAPAIVSFADLTQKLRNEPIVQRQLKRFP